MKKLRAVCAAALCGAVLIGTTTLQAADTKTYQVTGPVLALTPTTITVQKGEDKWEIARKDGTKVTGKLEVGAKVTIQYTMVAETVEVKDATKAKAKK